MQGSCSCNDFNRAQLLRRGVAVAGKGLPAIEPGMPLPAGTGMDRRSFLLRTAGAVVSVYGASMLGARHFEEGIAQAAATSPSQPVLVSIFMEGGWDALSVLAPVQEARYHELRPTLGLKEGEGVEFSEDETLMWHPSAAGLAQLHGEGKKIHVYGASTKGNTILQYAGIDGSLIEVANLIHYSNGLTLSKDGKCLLVAEMLAGRILSFKVNAGGTLGERTVWARMQDLAPPTAHEDAYNGPDGVKLGPDGNYYIAHNGSGRVLVVNADKKLVRIIKVPTPYVTNVNFGANGAATLYITGVFDPNKAPFPGAVYRWTR